MDTDEIERKKWIGYIKNILKHKAEYISKEQILNRLENILMIENETVEKDVNICLECNFEWEENNSLFCPKCGSGDFYIGDDENENICK